MENLDEETKRLLIGAAIGGILGVGAAFLFLGSDKQEKASSLSALGRVVVQMGEMLHKEDVKRTPYLKDVEKTVASHESAISDILKIVSSGVELWEKLKKGK